MSTLYEQRVKRLREHVLAHQKKEEKPAELTNKELMEKLKELGIEYDKKANKATLLALLEQAQKPEPEDDPDDNLDDDEGVE